MKREKREEFADKALARAWARGREVGREASEGAQKRLLAQEWFWAAGPVGCYRGGAGEVGTELVWAAGRERGWRMAAPGRGDGGRGYAWRWAEEGAAWVRGAHGLEEASGEAVAPGALRTVVIPGVAFDVRGVRLGHGGGDFDRLAAEAGEGAWRVGLCAESRLAGKLPREAHDAAVDAVVTEARVVYAAGAEERLARWLGGRA